MAKTANAIDNFKDASNFLQLGIESKLALKDSDQDFAINLYHDEFKKLSKQNNFIKDCSSKHPDAYSPAYIKQLQLLSSTVQQEILNLYSVCNQLFIKKIFPTAVGPKDQIKYYKFLTDIFNFVKDLPANQERASQINSVKEYYAKALTLAEGQYPRSHPEFLKIAINYSSFQYQCIKITETPTQLLFNTYSQARREMDKLSPQEYQDSVSLLQVMRDNMAAWTFIEEEEEEVHEAPHPQHKKK